MSTRKENLLILTLALLQFTNIVDFMIIMPLGKMLMRTLSVSTREFGLIVSAYTFSAGISGFLAMFYVDWFDRKSILRNLYIGFLLGTLACGMAGSYFGLVSARIFTGAFGGVLGAVGMSIVSDVVPLERRATAMGKMMAGFSAASVLGVPFGIYIANEFNWHAPFLFLAGLGLPVLLLIHFNVPHIREHIQAKKSKPMETLRAIFSVANHRKAILLGIVLMLGHFTIVPFISPYMVSNVGFTERQLTWIYLIGGGLTLFTSPLIGKLADKKGRLFVFSLFAVLCCIPIFLITHMTEIPIWQALIVSGIFFIFTGGRMIPMQAMISAAVQPSIRGSFMTLNSSMQQMMAGVASYMGGLIITEKLNLNGSKSLEHYDIVGYIAIVGSLLCIWVASRIQVIPANPIETKNA